MSWSCVVVSTRYVSWVSGQWPVSTIGRNNNFDGFPIQRHYKHTLATKYYQHTFTGDSVAKIYYHLVAQHHLPTCTHAQYMQICKFASFGSLFHVQLGSNNTNKTSYHHLIFSHMLEHQYYHFYILNNCIYCQNYCLIADINCSTLGKQIFKGKNTKMLQMQ